MIMILAHKNLTLLNRMYFDKTFKKNCNPTKKYEQVNGKQHTQMYKKRKEKNH